MTLPEGVEQVNWGQGDTIDPQRLRPGMWLINCQLDKLQFWEAAYVTDLGEVVQVVQVRARDFRQGGDWPRNPYVTHIIAPDSPFVDVLKGFEVFIHMGEDPRDHQHMVLAPLGISHD